MKPRVQIPYLQKKARYHRKEEKVVSIVITSSPEG
jgi:hypothetical protein